MKITFSFQDNAKLSDFSTMDWDSKEIENGLVVQSLNFHGNQLTNFMKDLPEFHALDLGKVDYALYQSRSRELRVEDRGRRLLLHRFITQNFKSIFRCDFRRKFSS